MTTTTEHQRLAMENAERASRARAKLNKADTPIEMRNAQGELTKAVRSLQKALHPMQQHLIDEWRAWSERLDADARTELETQIRNALQSRRRRAFRVGNFERRS